MCFKGKVSMLIDQRRCFLLLPSTFALKKIVLHLNNHLNRNVWSSQRNHQSIKHIFWKLNFVQLRSQWSLTGNRSNTTLDSTKVILKPGEHFTPSKSATEFWTLFWMFRHLNPLRMLLWSSSEDGFEGGRTLDPSEPGGYIEHILVKENIKVYPVFWVWIRGNQGFFRTRFRI